MLDKESFYSAVINWTHLEHCVKLCPLQYQKGTKDPRQVQQRTSKMTGAGALML